ncbi:MAG: antibiotic biosynthesis monooxygenase [bacterium]
MAELQNSTSQHVFRIDRFIVPLSAREEFLARVRQTHETLRMQPGFVRDLLVEQPADSGGVTILTLAEWDSHSRIEHAKAAVQAMQHEAQFNPRDLLARLGITAEMGLYHPVDH